MLPQDGHLATRSVRPHDDHPALFGVPMLPSDVNAVRIEQTCTALRAHAWPAVHALSQTLDYSSTHAGLLSTLLQTALELPQCPVVPITVAKPSLPEEDLLDRPAVLCQPALPSPQEPSPGCLAAQACSAIDLWLSKGYNPLESPWLPSQLDASSPASLQIVAHLVQAMTTVHCTTQTHLSVMGYLCTRPQCPSPVLFQVCLDAGGSPDAVDDKGVPVLMVLLRRLSKVAQSGPYSDSDRLFTEFLQSAQVLVGGGANLLAAHPSHRDPLGRLVDAALCVLDEYQTPLAGHPMCVELKEHLKKVQETADTWVGAPWAEDDVTDIDEDLLGAFPFLP